MDCITFEGKVVHTRLLTHAEKIRKLESLFSDKIQDSDLFLPDDAFYGKTVSPDDPERMADVLFKWLGIKHRSVQFHIDSNQEELLKYTHKKNASQIVLGYRVLDDPLLCAGIVAHGIIHHLLLARSKVSLVGNDENETLTDLGTIYAGFGLLILNSFESHLPVLGSMGMHNYANEFRDYCSQQRIVKTVWSPYTLPSVASDMLESKTNPSLLKPFIKSRLAKAQSRKFKIIVGCSILLVILCAFAVVQATRPNEISAEMLERQEAVTVLKNQYQQCLDFVAYKQERWDQSDIFIQRQIESDKTRCTSIKNRYNYELREFNAVR